MVRGTMVLAAVVGSLVGCVQEGGPAREPPRQPEAATPTKIVVYTGWPTDSDGNGFLDEFTVTVYLWDERFVAAPLQLPGTFELRAVVPGSATTQERTIASWVFAGERAAAAQRPATAGPAYEFRVSLLDAGTDRYDRLEVEPSVSFRGERGEFVQGRGGTIWLGRPNR